MINLAYVGNMITRRKISSTLIVTLILNIVAPTLTFAALPSFDSTLTTPNVAPVAQVSKIPVPRDLVSGDLVEITIDGTYVSQLFDTTSDNTLDLFSDNINSLVSSVSSNYDSTDRTLIITANVPGIPYLIGDLLITRSPIIPNITVPNIVAVAQESNVAIPQNLFDGDTLVMNISGTGVLENFSGSKDETLQAFADKITLLTDASGSYDSSSNTINLIAKTPGIGFGMSNLNIASNGINVAHPIPNIIPVSQVEKITFPREIYSDETITLTINSNTPTIQSFQGDSDDTISSLSDQIDALPEVSSSVSGNEITITSEIPGTPFTVSQVDITGGTVNSINSIPNIEAVSQIDHITVPRDVYFGDIIHFSVNGIDVSQGFNGTNDNTLNDLSDNIIADVADVTSSVNLTNRTLTISSTKPGTPFTASGLFISSDLTSSGVISNVIAQKKKSIIALQRPFQSGDVASLVINGNTISENFAITADDTLNSLAAKINSGTLNIIATPDTAMNSITLESSIAGVDFNVSNVSILNSLYPTILQASSKSVNQRNIFSIPSDLFSGDNISLNVDGTDILQNFSIDANTTLDELNTKMNDVATVNSTLNIGTKTFTLDATTAGTPFSISNVSISGSTFTGITMTGSIPEVKASLDISIDSVPADSTNIIIGSCTIDFSTGSVTVDTDCSDDSAILDISGISSTSTIAALLRGISGISDPNNGILNTSGTGVIATYKTSGIQDNLNNINFFDGTSGSISGNLTGPQLAVAQVDSLVIPRDFVSGDTFSVTVDGIPVIQNFTSDSITSLINLNNTLNSLPGIDSSVDIPSRTFTLTAKDAGYSFNLGTASFSNVQAPILTISNFVGATQKSEIDLPSNFVPGDEITIVVNGITSTGSFSSDSLTTLNNIISQINANVTTVNATASGSLGIVIEGKNAGDAFTIDKTEIKNTTAPTSVNPNVTGVAQVDTLTIPYPIESTDNISININGNIINQPFTTDTDTTLSLMNSQITNLPEISSVVNTASGEFTLTSKNPGTGFSASLQGTGVTINSINSQPNVDSGSQVDTLTVSRTLTSGDSLSLDIAGSTLVQSFSGSKDETLQALSDKINTLSEINSSFDSANSTFTITSNTPGIAFVSGILNITSATNSVNMVANVPAQAQVDSITLPRAIIAGDMLSINIDGNLITEVFSGSESETLDSFKSKVDSIATGVSLNISGSDLVFTATTAGVPFSIGSFTIDNSISPATTVDNVVAVKQETEMVMPTLVEGDFIGFSIDGNSILQNFDTDENTTINQILLNINAIGSVTSSFNSGTINLTSNIAGIPFVTSNVSIINSTTPITVTANGLPVAQVVDMTPSGIFRAGITFRAVIDGVDNDYLTLNGDSAAEIVSGLADAIMNNSNTGVTVSTGSNILTLTASTPGIPFIYQSLALDITPPIASAPINAAQTLKSGASSTSNVSIDEDGDIYLVLTGTTVSTVAELNAAVANGSGFVIRSVLAGSINTITVPNGISDGLYNIIGSDPNDNVSQSVPGWLTVDNTAPIVNITTQSQTINTATINIAGTTEPNISVSIDNSGSVTNIVSDGAGDFNSDITLDLDAVNNISVSATDVAGNIGTSSVVIISDTLTPNPLVINAPAFTNSTTADISVQTESGILAEVFSGAILVSSGTTDSTGSMIFTVPLDINSVNSFHIIVTDSGSNTNSGNVTIIQDSISPNVILDPLPSIVNANSINISGTTEPNSDINITSSGTTVSNGASDSSGIFSISTPLSQDAMNSFSVIATDPALNISAAANVSITEDSVPNALIIGTPSLSTSQNSIILTGSTKPNSSIQIIGGASVANGTPDSAGDFSINVSLTLNASNNLIITSTDLVGNIVSGNLVITQDNMYPTVNISTQSQTTNNQIVNIDGITESNSTIVISGGSGTFFGVSDIAGNFSIPVTLNSDSVNNISVVATDAAGNSGNGNVSITHDSVVIFLNMSVANSFTRNPTFTFTGNTKKNADVVVTGGSGAAINTVGDSVTGDFTVIVPLNLNSANNISVTATDATTLSASQGFMINQDDIAPILTVNTLPASINTNNVTLTGTTESGATVNFSNGVSNISSIADSSGNYTLTFPLILNSINTLNGSSVDLAGNSSTGVTLDITHDNLGPALSNLVVIPNVSGIVMNMDYSFNTNEFSTSTLYVGTGSNVLSTLVASGTTSGTGHSSVIPGLLPNQTYYYFIDSSDNLGNITNTVVSALNSIDTTGPQIFGVSITNITVAGAIFNFLFNDSHFNQNTFANGTLSITDGTNIINTIPQLTFGNIVNNTGTAVFNTLLSGTNYLYNLVMQDDFGNISSSNGAFTTATDVSLNSNSGTIVQTGSVALSLTDSVNNTLSMSGNTLIINSSTGSNLLNSNITIPGNTTLTYPNGWNGVITSPVLVDPNAPQSATVAELTGLIASFNTPTVVYSGTILNTVSVSGNVPVGINGGYFIANFEVQNGAAGDTVNIFRSTDGNTWQQNVPDRTCILDSAKTCNFRTDSLSYFTVVKLTGNMIVISNNGGGGGGSSSISVDSCPNGDYSNSYYDSSCGTKPSVISNTSVLTNSESIKRFIYEAKKSNYPQLPTIDSKIKFWENVIATAETALKDTSITKEKEEYNSLVITRSKAVIKGLTDLKNLNIKPSEGNNGSNQNSGTPVSNPSIDSSLKNPQVEIIKNPKLVVYKFLNVANSYAIREFDSFSSKIISYLPRNYKVELLDEQSNGWSKILFDGYNGFIRSKYLRDENQSDRNRTLPSQIFYEANSLTNIDWKKIKVARSVFVRTEPYPDSKIKTTLFNGEKIIILDVVDGFTEIMWQDGIGFVKSEFITD
ncbi:MAG: Ig-like domain-containing protein [Candidatus Gracilibacteria bacterium]|nr:Ig-like domain-containing protein [Candidatus Gracilibacteria bacterium]